jgi:hypothetical protein
VKWRFHPGNVDPQDLVAPPISQLNHQSQLKQEVTQEEYTKNQCCQSRIVENSSLFKLDYAKELEHCNRAI